MHKSPPNLTWPLKSLVKEEIKCPSVRWWLQMLALALWILSIRSGTAASAGSLPGVTQDNLAKYESLLRLRFRDRYSKKQADMNQITMRRCHGESPRSHYEIKQSNFFSLVSSLSFNITFLSPDEHQLTVSYCRCVFVCVQTYKDDPPPLLTPFYLQKTVYHLYRPMQIFDEKHGHLFCNLYKKRKEMWSE